MNAKYGCRWAVALCGAVILIAVFWSQRCCGQEGTERPKKVLTPEQLAYQQQWKEFMDKHHRLQAQGKAVFDAEMAREKAGDCPNARSNADFINCFGDQLTITDGNLKTFEGIIQALQAPGPQMPGQAEVTGDVPGIAGPALTPQHFIEEFERVEKIWGEYRETACTAAFHQFDGGTGGPSFEGQCELNLTRDHMRELDMIYGGDLHL